MPFRSGFSLFKTYKHHLAEAEKLPGSIALVESLTASQLEILSQIRAMTEQHANLTLLARQRVPLWSTISFIEAQKEFWCVPCHPLCRKHGQSLRLRCERLYNPQYHCRDIYIPAICFRLSIIFMAIRTCVHACISFASRC